MSWRENDLTKSKLPGKKVSRILVSAGEDTLVFMTECGYTEAWMTDGDCCSQSWWADAYGLGQLRSQTVKAVKSIGLPEQFYNVEDGRTRQEYDSAYGYEIETNWGTATFVFRNSSNGYYGGSAYLAADGTKLARDQFREITDNDWSA